MIKLARIAGGELIIGEVRKDMINDKLHLTNSRTINMMPTRTGMGFMFIPPIPFIKDTDLDISYASIIKEVNESDIPKDLLDNYKYQVSGIKPANNSIII